MTDRPNELNELPSDLNDLWNRQEDMMTTTELSLTDPKQLTAALQSGHRKERARLIRLNFREVIPALGLAALFAWLGLATSATTWAFLAAALIALAVGGYLLVLTIRQHRIEAAFDDTIKGQLERTLSQLNHRAGLYRTVLWWYLLPVAAAIGLVVSTARPLHMAFVVIYGGLVVGLGVFLYRANRRLGREQYEAQIPRYEALLNDLG